MCETCLARPEWSLQPGQMTVKDPKPKHGSCSWDTTSIWSTITWKESQQGGDDSFRMNRITVIYLCYSQ